MRASVLAIAMGVVPWATSVSGQSAPPDSARRPPVTLPAVEVSDKTPPPARYDGFEFRRQRRSGGQFITREEIERRDPKVTTDLLRRLQGLRIADSMGVPVAISTRGPKLKYGILKNCVLRVGVNGTVSHVLPLNSIPPVDIYGIEVYSSASMPVEFSGSRRDGYCGLIMIWTR